MRPALKLILIALPLAAIGAGFLAYAVVNRPEPARIDIAERAVPVRFVEVTPASLPPRVTGNGLVRPARVFEAVAEVGGTVEWLDPGLETGMFLRLSKADYSLAVAQAEANVRATEAKLEELELSESNQKAALELERKLLDIRTADRDQGQLVAIFDGIDAAEVEVRISLSEMSALTSPSADGGHLLDPVRLGEQLRAMGLQAEVRLGLGGRQLIWPAQVDRLSDTVDQKTGTLGVILRVDNAYSSARPGLRPPLTKGMFVEAVLSAPGRSGIIVPRSAVHEGRVMIADDENRLRLLPVTILRAQDQVALIGEGLEAGMRLIVSDLSPRIPGQLLAPVRDEALEKRLAAESAVAMPERRK